MIGDRESLAKDVQILMEVLPYVTENPDKVSSELLRFIEDYLLTVVHDLKIAAMEEELDS